jgi:ketosteroid isomerase-like protein
MSQENVELVRRFYEAAQRSLAAYWNNRRSGADALKAGDLDPETEAMLAFIHPEFEYSGLLTTLEGGVAHGHLGWVEAWAPYLGAAEDARITVSELVDLGGDQVLGVAETTVRWKGSGMTLTEPRFAVVSVRDGLIVRLNVYRDRAEALEAGVLRE